MKHIRKQKGWQYITFLPLWKRIINRLFRQNKIEVLALQDDWQDYIANLNKEKDDEQTL